MKILHISDTHGCHHKLKDLPQADVLVHSGDFTMAGTEAEALDFLNWFCDLDYPHKIFITGNHDYCLYDGNVEGLPDNVHDLRNAAVTIEGVRFYGVPMYHHEEGGRRREANCYEAIPNDTDVLVTHCPAYGIMDLDEYEGKPIRYGDLDLLRRIETVKPPVHLFGHIHSQHGILRRDGVIHSNAAIMDNDYIILNSPNIIEI